MALDALEHVHFYIILKKIKDHKWTSNMCYIGQVLWRKPDIY